MPSASKSHSTILSSLIGWLKKLWDFLAGGISSWMNRGICQTNLSSSTTQESVARSLMTTVGCNFEDDAIRTSMRIQLPRYDPSWGMVVVRPWWTRLWEWMVSHFRRMWGSLTGSPVAVVPPSALRPKYVQQWTPYSGWFPAANCAASPVQHLPATVITPYQEEMARDLASSLCHSNSGLASPHLQVALQSAAAGKSLPFYQGGRIRVLAVIGVVAAAALVYFLSKRRKPRIALVDRMTPEEALQSEEMLPLGSEDIAIVQEIADLVRLKAMLTTRPPNLVEASRNIAMSKLKENHPGIPVSKYRSILMPALTLGLKPTNEELQLIDGLGEGNAALKRIHAWRTKGVVKRFPLLPTSPRWLFGWNEQVVPGK